MQLSSYLKKSGVTAAEFAKRIGVDKTTVYRYIRGERIPNRDALSRIMEETEGAVTANDFFCQSAPGRECAVA
jgi:transcriptional regulator with XRE-family HTH domain